MREVQLASETAMPVFALDDYRMPSAVEFKAITANKGATHSLLLAEMSITLGIPLSLPDAANDNNPPPKPANAGQMPVPLKLAA